MGFVNIGILSWMIMKENFETVVAFAEEALSMDHSLEGQTTLSAYGWVLSWKKDLSTCSRAFEVGYNSSMRIGDVEPAMWILCLYQVCKEFHIRRYVDSVETFVAHPAFRYGSRSYWAQHWKAY